MAYREITMRSFAVSTPGQTCQDDPTLIRPGLFRSARDAISGRGSKGARAGLSSRQRSEVTGTQERVPHLRPFGLCNAYSRGLGGACRQPGIRTSDFFVNKPGWTTPWT